jgi:DNA-binding XRE family transcriptional regulator
MGEAHYLSKLHAVDVPIIRRSPLSQRKLGEKYGVCRQTISNIKCGKVWRSVPDEPMTLAA